MQIAPGIYSMGNWKGGRVRAFLLDDGHGLTLVDTLFESSAQVILAEIKALGGAVTDLKRIVMTHAHRSHLGGLARLKQLTGAPVYAHEWEAGIIMGERKAPRVRWRPMAPLAAYPYQLGLNLRLDQHHVCPVDHVLADGQEVGPLVVVHTPGHTPGHLAFYWPERGLMITGDIVATWPDLSPGWPAFTLDPQQHRASVRRMTGFKPTILAVGHGDPLVGSAEEDLHKLMETADHWAAS